MRAVVSLLLLLSAATGCVPTRFEGKPKVESGPAGCQRICSAWDMELAGMVAMGAYSDGCICQVRGKTVAMATTGAAGPAVAGVWMQMQEEQREEERRDEQRRRDDDEQRRRDDDEQRRRDAARRH